MMLTDFYAESRWGDRWNALRPNGRRHKGFDIKAKAGESVPALRAGRVTTVFWHSELGWTVVVETTPGDVTGYSHVKGAVGVGTKVNAGDHLAFIAGPGEETGAAWTGPHTHIVVAASPYTIYMGPTRDPEPLIVAALTTLAGDAQTPEEDDMALRFGTDETGKKVYLLGGPAGPQHVKNPTHLTLLQRYVRANPELGDSKFTDAEYAIIRSYFTPGIPDGQVTQAALQAALRPLLEGLPEATAKATRAAIIK